MKLFTQAGMPELVKHSWYSTTDSQPKLRELYYVLNRKVPERLVRHLLDYRKTGSASYVRRTHQCVMWDMRISEILQTVSPDKRLSALPFKEVQEKIEPTEMARVHAKYTKAHEELRRWVIDAVIDYRVQELKSLGREVVQNERRLATSKVRLEKLDADISRINDLRNQMMGESTEENGK